MIGEVILLDVSLASPRIRTTVSLVHTSIDHNMEEKKQGAGAHDCKIKGIQQS